MVKAMEKATAVNAQSNHGVVKFCIGLAAIVGMIAISAMTVNNIQSDSASEQSATVVLESK